MMREPQHRRAYHQRLRQANPVVAGPQDGYGLLAFGDAPRRVGRHADAIAAPDAGGCFHFGTARPFGAQRITEPAGSFEEVTGDEPQPGHPRYQRQRRVSIARGDVPVERGPQVARLGDEAVPPHRPGSAAQTLVGFLSRAPIIRPVAGTYGAGFAGFGEPVPAVLPQRLELA